MVLKQFEYSAKLLRGNFFSLQKVENIFLQKVIFAINSLRIPGTARR
jgi:hypothetical protein